MAKKITIETDDQTYEEIIKLFSKLNLTIEDAINIFLKEAIIENTLPQLNPENDTFELIQSNEKIIN